MAFENLTEDNYLLYAAKVYEKPNAVFSELEEDLNRIVYLKRLLTKYYVNNVLKDRLIMNHLIVIYNVFGVEAATRMLFFKLDEKDLGVIKPFLLFLDFLPKFVYGINGKNIETALIKMDENAISCLRKISKL